MTLPTGMSAVLSACGRYRYRLDRDVQQAGLVLAYFGVNPSTADAEVDDQTVKKWFGFTRLAGGRRFIVGNPFAYRSRDIEALAMAADPVGADNADHLRQIIAEADIVVPCWGSRTKLPRPMHRHLDALREQLHQTGKPIRIFGLCKSGDPAHPLMLGYDTRLVPLQA